MAALSSLCACIALPFPMTLPTASATRPPAPCFLLPALPCHVLDTRAAIIFPSDRDGGDMDDYDDSAVAAAIAAGGSSTGGGSSSSAAKRRPVRTPNPERDASFFFRPESPEERRQRLRVAAAEAAEAEAGLTGPVPRTRTASWEGLSPGQVRSRIAKSGRCSALIKVRGEGGGGGRRREEEEEGEVS